MNDVIGFYRPSEALLAIGRPLGDPFTRLSINCSGVRTTSGALGTFAADIWLLQDLFTTRSPTLLFFFRPFFSFLQYFFVYFLLRFTTQSSMI